MAPVATRPAVTVDLDATTTRAVNQLLASPDAPKGLRITNPRGAHALACGLDADLFETRKYSVRALTRLRTGEMRVCVVHEERHMVDH